MFGRMRRERRATDYTDDAVAAIVAAAQGTTAEAQKTAAVEFAAGAIGRALAACNVEGPAALAAALTPAVREQIGRRLVNRGEWVALIEFEAGAFELIPAAAHDIRGSRRRDTWRYRCDLAGPTRTAVRNVGADRVLHLTWATEPARPWCGVGPLTGARLTARTLANVEQAAGDETSGARGYLIPIPKGGKDPTVEGLRKDIGGLRGRTSVSETTAGAWGLPGGPEVAPRQDLRPVRVGAYAGEFGAQAGAVLRELRGDVAAAVLAACGVPPELYRPGSGADAREGWRRFVTATVEPLAAALTVEIRRALDPRMRIDPEPLTAALDLASRARAFRSLVDGGMDVAQAATASGVIGGD